MAKVTNSFFGSFKGRIGNYVFYELRGVLIIRTIGKSLNSPTHNQLIQRSRMRLTNNFLKSIKTYVNLGFELQAKGTSSLPFNKATATNSQQIVTGDYPAHQLDFSKALLTKGDLPLLKDAKVSVGNDGLEFTWNPTVDAEFGEYWQDQVMLMAFCEQNNHSYKSYAGATRELGRDLLQLPLSGAEGTYHVYISVVADDRKRISNSLYLGPLKWG